MKFKVHKFKVPLRRHCPSERYDFLCIQTHFSRPLIWYIAPLWIVSTCGFPYYIRLFINTYGCEKSTQTFVKWSIDHSDGGVIVWNVEPGPRRVCVQAVGYPRWGWD